MDIVRGHYKVPHMVGGTGEHSYANNSSMQRVVMAKVKHIVDEAISVLYSSMLPESLAIGDLGCSSGPNALALISQVIHAIDLESQKLSRAPPELVFYLNDLHGNDFNSVFQSLLAFHEKLIRKKGEGLRTCYVGAMPGSFYGRLFPKTSLHFIHSSYSLHWLSQVPPELTSTSNKGNIHLTKSSSPLVIQAYLEQYKRDFHLFLRSRSEELLSGGRMVLTLMASTADPSCVDGNRVWEQLGQALYHLASQGLIEESKLDAFNMPYYAPTAEELEEVVEREGSFDLDKLETMKLIWNVVSEEGDEGNYDPVVEGIRVAKGVRALTEPLLATYFEAHLMDQVYQKYGNIMAEDFPLGPKAVANLIVTLTKRI